MTQAHKAPARVAVLMAVHNDAPFVGAAARSILTQTFTELELVVVDDASTDGSREIVEAIRDPRVRILRNAQNIGLTASLNRGLASIRSEYVARIDANDFALPERLAKQVAFLDAHSDVAAVGSRVSYVDRQGRPIRRALWFHRESLLPTGGAALDWFRMFDTPLFHPAATFRRSVVEELGGYDDRYPLEQDADLWRRIAARHHLANVPERLMRIRIDRSSMTGDPERQERVGYRERKIPFVHGVMQDVLRWPDIPRKWAETWVDVNTPKRDVDAASLRELALGIRTCEARFRELFPESAHDRSIARHQASVFVRMLDKAIGREPRLALSFFRSIVRCDPATALLGLPRITLRILGFGTA